MSIIRLIHIKIDSAEIESALKVWKEECAPLMIQQKGCLSEKLLRCRDAHELILTRSGPPRQTLISTRTVMLTKKLFGTHAP